MKKFEACEDVSSSEAADKAVAMACDFGEGDRTGDKTQPAVSSVILAASLSACGGSGSASQSAETVPVVVTPTYLKPATRADAARFLLQASFGANDADIERVMSLGYEAWIDEQLDNTKTPPVSLMTHIRTVDPDRKGTSAFTFGEAFYQNVVKGRTPLRDRIAFELSKIFVISSLYFLEGGHTANYYDMLATKGTTTYRELLEAVTLNPTMGNYLSMVSNQKENSEGRIPDQNYAREVMQLFSIGLYALNIDGTQQTDASGMPIPTYTQDDVVGLSRVFTGYGYGGADRSDARFFGWVNDPDIMYTPMAFYPQFHSTMEKSFLGKTLNGSGEGDLTAALDVLSRHPNVAPNFAKQLIKRFVTSNPSPGYIQRIAQTFLSTNGDMKATFKAILLDSEARDSSQIANVSFGKVREPLLRLLALLRGFGATSDSGVFRMQITDDVASLWGQTPLRAPSVFNFYRPGFIPPLTKLAQHSLTAPEMQMLHEVSIVGFANSLEYCLNIGFGFYQGPRPDIRLTFHDNSTAAEFASTDLRLLADVPAELVARIDLKLFSGQMADALKSQLVGATSAIAIPSSDAGADSARKLRIKAAIYLAMVSPQFHVQR